MVWLVPVLCHTYASQGVMNGVGLTAVGKLPGHRRRETTAIYAHMDDAAQVGTVIARAMGVGPRCRRTGSRVETED